MTNPTVIPGTRRQRVVTGNGIVLEKQAIYLPAESWEALKQLSEASHRSGSQVIQNLIEIANRSSQTEKKNEQRSTSANSARK